MPDTVPVEIGENVAVIINLEADEYPGLTFLNSDFGLLPLEAFVAMIEGLEIN